MSEVTVEYTLAITTTANAEDADDLAKKIVAEGLAACVQIQSITSHYVWKGEACREPEALLLIKTRAELFSRLTEFIVKNHKYETPELIQIPIVGGLQAYLSWIDTQTNA